MHRCHNNSKRTHGARQCHSSTWTMNIIETILGWQKGALKNVTGLSYTAVYVHTWKLFMFFGGGNIISFQSEIKTDRRMRKVRLVQFLCLGVLLALVHGQSDADRKVQGVRKLFRRKKLLPMSEHVSKIQQQPLQQATKHRKTTFKAFPFLTKFPISRRIYLDLKIPPEILIVIFRLS